MDEHRVVIEKRGRSFGVWEPGEAGGIHERIGYNRDAFPDGWELVRARCTCGQAFDVEADVWAHLDEVAAKLEVNTAEVSEEARGALLDPPVVVGKPIGEPTYPVKADIFSQQDVGPDTATPRFMVTGHLTDRVVMSWTVAEVLADLNERVSLPGDLEYDTVFFTVNLEGGEEMGLKGPKRVTVRLPPSAVLADEIPERELVRVTNAEHAPYEIVGSSE